MTGRGQCDPTTTSIPVPTYSNLQVSTYVVGIVVLAIILILLINRRYLVSPSKTLAHRFVYVMALAVILGITGIILTLRYVMPALCRYVFESLKYFAGIIEACTVNRNTGHLLG